MNVVKILKIVFLCVFLLLSPVAALDWEYVTVSRVIDAEHFVTRDENIIKILGYDGPDPYFPTLVERGILRRTQRLLKLLMANKNIQILAEDNERSGVLMRHVKLDSGQLLSEFLIEKGYGRADTAGIKHFSRKINSAEQVARSARVGIWDTNTIHQGFLERRQVASCRAREWRKKFGHHLAGSSIGRVSRVLRGDLVEMDDGVRVRLIGLQAPDPDDERLGYACFGASSKEMLSAYVLGKKVQLIPDRININDDFEIPRYIWLLGDPNKFGSDVHINRKMIEDGFGRSNWDTADDRYKNEFEVLQREVYDDPRGAWVSCSREILKK